MKQNIITLLLFYLVIIYCGGCGSSLDPALTAEFFMAVGNNNLNEVNAMLEKEPNLVYARDELGYTPLMAASRFGNKTIVGVLLKNKSEVNAQSNMGETALFRTIDVNKYKNAELLLKYGADPDIKEYSQGWSALSCACYYGNLHMVRLLLKNRANINIKGKYEQTPLHWSIRAINLDNQKQIVKLLLEEGVNADHEDIVGQTALQMAESRSAEGVVELLRSYSSN
jgi:ankyrin repeat protein